MPFKEHPEFLPPASSNAKIWRYMDLAKFLSLLDKNSLYFARLDKLSEFDPFEGCYTYLNLQFDNIDFNSLPEVWKEATGIKDEGLFNAIKHGNKQSRGFAKFQRSLTFVNSWHMKEYESAAMWKIYLTSNEGIAVQSTYGRLVESLASYNDFEVQIGKIKYIDYEKEAIPMGNLLLPFMHKRKSFEHEEELRALIWTPQHGKNDISDPQNNKYANDHGLYVGVDLDLLIDKIFVAPNASSWVSDSIKTVVEKFGLNKKIKQSDLASTPMY